MSLFHASVMLLAFTFEGYKEYTIVIVIVSNKDVVVSSCEFHWEFSVLARRRLVYIYLVYYDAKYFISFCVVGFLDWRYIQGGGYWKCGCNWLNFLLDIFLLHSQVVFPGENGFWKVFFDEGFGLICSGGKLVVVY